jgi:hypothetical protein
MTPRANYAAFVDNIFGAGSAKFDIAKTDTNNVIGALVSTRGFTEFKANFEERLRRINAAIQFDPNLRKDVIGAVNRVAEDEWDVAYAELCALDYFLTVPLTGSGNIELDQTVPASDTLASEMGMQNANHDMRLKSLGVSMDTKNLSDKTGQIFDGVFDEFRKAKGIASMMIMPTYDHDDDFTPYAANRPQLLAELVSGVGVNGRTQRLTSQVCASPSFPDTSFPQASLDEAFRLAIGLRSIGPSERVFDTQRVASLVEQPGAIGRSVVGEQALDLHTQGRVVRHRRFEEVHR